jgi:hypothetical protein
MTLQEARNLLNRITYKPGWKFALSGYDYGNKTYLEIEITTICAVTGKHDCLLRNLTCLDLSSFDNEEFINKLRYFVLLTETHELDEWLKIDGFAINDPHDAADWPAKTDQR